MGPLDHLPIIEAIALHLEFQDMKSLLWVSRNCAKCFRFSRKIKRRIGLMICIQEYPFMIRDIDQNELLCLEAVKSNGTVIEYCENQTKKLCLEAVKECCSALYFIKNITKRICIEALKWDRDAIEYVPNKFKYLYRN
jgi:hypothetical protein